MTTTNNLPTAATKDEAVEFVNELLTDAGQKPLRESDIRDWDIRAGDTFAQLEGYVKDFLSECHTEECAAKNEWRYQL